MPNLDPSQVPSHTGTNYPDAFKAVVAGRSRQRLGDAVGLTRFGVNLVTLAPGSCSALRHWHQVQDEFIYVLMGELTLITDVGEQLLSAGMAAGFPAGQADGHHLVNRSQTIAQYLEIGDRTPHEVVSYPDVDLVAVSTPDGWCFTHKDGTPYLS